MRESLFSIIAAHLRQARILDVFAGTGALGIEALSRGAARAVFVEQERKVVALLQRNLEPFVSCSRVMAAPAQAAIKELGAAGTTFDLIFLDPPYAKELLEPTLQALVRHAILAEGALVICEHHGKTAAPTGPAPLILQQTRLFGDVAITLFCMPEGAILPRADADKGLRP